MKAITVFVEIEQQLAIKEKHMETEISKLNRYQQVNICTFTKIRTFWSVLWGNARTMKLTYISVKVMVSLKCCRHHMEPTNY